MKIRAVLGQLYLEHRSQRVERRIPGFVLSSNNEFGKGFRLSYFSWYITNPQFFYEA